MRRAHKRDGGDIAEEQKSVPVWPYLHSFRWMKESCQFTEAPVLLAPAITHLDMVTSSFREGCDARTPLSLTCGQTNCKTPAGFVSEKALSILSICLPPFLPLSVSALCHFYMMSL